MGGPGTSVADRRWLLSVNHRRVLLLSHLREILSLLEKLKEGFAMKVVHRHHSSSTSRVLLYSQQEIQSILSHSWRSVEETIRYRHQTSPMMRQASQ